MVLIRFEGNPILEPRQQYSWESKAVFNPGAIYLNGKVHIVYRAIGDSDTSVLGYASSSDGLNIDERLDQPIYAPREPFEGVHYSSHSLPYYMSYASGGGIGGCEDPRLTRIGDRIFMAYVAYDGYSPPRVALTSILTSDFLSRKWRWASPVLISPPGIVDKNACIFEELIGGKYVIMHRIFPDILIDFVDNLDFDGKTKWLKGDFSISPRADYWDSRKIGAGPPPIKTDKGWLLIYHAVDDSDPGYYKIGAMLLDLRDPTRVIALLNKPILRPEARYETEGNKANVVYPCGAVKIGESVFVYYGGADTVVCVATAKLDDILRELVPQEPVHHLPMLKPKASLMITADREVQAYCFRCRKKRVMNNPRITTLKNARTAIQGECPVCGSKMSRIGRLRGL